MATRSTIVYPNPELLAQAVAARTLLTIGDLLAEAGRMRVDIAVTGGTDGNRVFAELKASPLSATVDWSRVHIWWGDERFVAADGDDRNAKQARRVLFDGMIADGTPIFGLTGWAGTFAALDAAAIGCIVLMAMVAVLEERKIRRENRAQKLKTA